MADINYLGPPAFLIPLGKVSAIYDNKDANLFIIPLPGGDAGETEAIDSLGITQYINVEGRMTGDFSSIQTKIAQIKLLADGFQTAAFDFKSPFISTNQALYTSTTTTILVPLPVPTYVPIITFVKSGSQLRMGNLGTTTAISFGQDKLIDASAAFVTWGTQVGDKVKNLNTGLVATVTSIDSPTQLSVDTSIFTNEGDNYAVTATILVKVMSIAPKWELPGMGYCDYTLSLVQVAR